MVIFFVESMKQISHGLIPNKYHMDSTLGIMMHIGNEWCLECETHAGYLLLKYCQNHI